MRYIFLWSVFLAAELVYADDCSNLLMSRAPLTPDALVLVSSTCKEGVKLQELDALPKKYELLNTELKQTIREQNLQIFLFSERMHSDKFTRHFFLDYVFRGKVLSKLGLGMVNDALDESSKSTLEHLEKHYEIVKEELVARHLATLDKDMLLRWNHVIGLPPENRYLELKQLLRDVRATALNGVNDQHVAEKIDGMMTTKLIDHLTRRVATTESLQAESQKYIKEGVEENKKQLSKLSKDMGAYYHSYLIFKKEQTEAVGNIQKSLNNMVELMNREYSRFSQSIQENQHLIRENSRGIYANHLLIRQSLGQMQEISHDMGFLKEFVFSQMSPDEKLRALERGMFHNLKPEDRSVLTQRIQLVKAEQQLLQQVATITNYADSFVKIGTTLGMDAKALKIVQAGSIGVKLFTTIISGGNPLAVIDLVGGIFSIFRRPKKDPMLANLNAILQNQKIIVDNQHVIIEMVQQSLKNEEMLFENQKRIQSSLQVINTNVLEAHKQQMIFLEEVLQDILINRNLIRTNMVKEALDCESFFDPQARSLYEKEYLVNGRFTKYNSLLTHFDDYYDVFSNCKLGLTRIIGNSQFSQAALFIDSYKDQIDHNAYNHQMHHIYEPTLNYTFDLISQKRSPLLKDLKTAFTSLTIATKKTSGLDLKYLENNPLESESYVKDDLLALLQKPIVTKALLNYANYAIQIYPYLEILNREGKELLSFNQLAERVSAPRRGVDLLTKLEHVLNLAIAQENLYAGDPLIPFFAQDLAGKTVADQEVKDAYEKQCQASKPEVTALCLLSSNSLLAYNYLQYSLNKHLSKERGGFIKYDLALRAKDQTDLMNQLLGPKWQIQYGVEPQKGALGQMIPQGWSAKIGVAYVSLPDAWVVEQNETAYRTDVKDLLKVRNEVSTMLSQAQLLQNPKRADVAQLYKRAVYSYFANTIQKEKP